MKPKRNLTALPHGGITNRGINTLIPPWNNECFGIKKMKPHERWNNDFFDFFGPFSQVKPHECVGIMVGIKLDSHLNIKLTLGYSEKWKTSRTLKRLDFVCFFFRSFYLWIVFYKLHFLILQAEKKAARFLSAAKKVWAIKYCAEFKEQQ